MHNPSDTKNMKWFLIYCKTLLYGQHSSNGEAVCGKANSPTSTLFREMGFQQSGKKGRDS